MSNAFPVKNESEEGDPLLSHNYIFGLKYVLAMPKKSRKISN
jgi:hypothetical protein